MPLSAVPPRIVSAVRAIKFYLAEVLRTKCENPSDKVSVLVHVFLSFPEALGKAAQRSKKLWQEEIIDEIQEVWSAKRGSAVKSVLKLSARRFQLLTQLLCQRYCPERKFYVPLTLKCGLRFPQLFVNASKSKVKNYDQQILDNLNIQQVFGEADNGDDDIPGGDAGAANADDAGADPDAPPNKKPRRSKSTSYVLRDIGKAISSRIVDLGARLDLTQPIEVPAHHPSPACPRTRPYQTRPDVFLSSGRIFHRCSYASTGQETGET